MAANDYSMRFAAGVTPSSGTNGRGPRRVPSPRMTRVSSRASSPPARSTSATTSGALRHWVDDQHERRRVPLRRRPPRPHRHRGPGELGERHACELAAMLFAVGLDPDVATVFVQSHVHRARRAGLADGVHGVSFGELQPHDAVQGQVRQARGEFVSGRAVHLPGAAWPPTSCCTTPTRCRSATTSASTSSSPATSPSASTTASATRSSCPRRSRRRPAPG